MRTVAPLTALLLGMGTTAALAQVPPAYANVAYARESSAQKLDIYLPAGQGPFPVVVWIHGGGWQSGDKSTGANRAPALLARGLAVASINYRLSGEAIFPAQIHDCKAAIRFLRARAVQYRLDPTRIGTWGSSAGGHLSALVGTSAEVAELEGAAGGNLLFSSRVQASADYFGPTDILQINLDVTVPPGSTINHDAPTSPESKLVGWSGAGQGIGNIRANLENPLPPYPALVLRCNQVNPITFVDTGEPPFFIAHGTADTSVPLRQSTRLHDALAAAGVVHDYREVVGAGHGNLGAATDEAVAAFFGQHLGDLAPLAPDLTGDRRVDSGDVALMQSCRTGPAAGPPADACARADLDGDRDVDQDDFGLLQRCFRGTSATADAACPQ